jgi:hypothetical protein
MRRVIASLSVILGFALLAAAGHRSAPNPPAIMGVPVSGGAAQPVAIDAAPGAKVASLPPTHDGPAIPAGKPRDEVKLDAKYYCKREFKLRATEPQSVSFPSSDKYDFASIEGNRVRVRASATLRNAMGQEALYVMDCILEGGRTITYFQVTPAD